jgi:drug/metabolite transporter (DMT)-like permease
MKRTSATVLLVAAAIGGVAGFLLDQLLTSSGRSTFTPVIMLPILLVLIGMLCLALAWPVRRSLRDPKAPHVDPFRALRIAVLAKASSLLGVLVAAALVAEHFCTLPKDPDEREPDDPGAGVEPHH